MKVIALNGSPRGKNSATNKLLSTLLQGMELAGAECQLVHLANAQISPCSGCFACWTITPEKCIIRDEMDDLLKLYVESDLVIFGTPLHTYMMSSLLKKFIDRSFPLHTSTMIDRSSSGQSLSSLTTRRQKPHKMLIVANCGFPEYEHFSPLSYYFQHLAKMLDKEYLGEILQPMGEILKKSDAQPNLIPYYSLLRKIGKTLIEKGRIEHEHLDRLKERWIIQNPKNYQELANNYYRSNQ